MMSECSETGACLRQYRHPEDYPAVINLWRAAGPGVHVGASDTEEEIGRKVERDPDLFLVAEQEGALVGSVIGGFDGRRGLVYHLAVHPGLRRQGLGQRLMDEVERRLAQKGCLRSYLLVLRDNTTAIEFYQKRGWGDMDGIAIFAKDLIPDDPAAPAESCRC
jgi:ribosomal protein S18 acetylase RimI-like enzyme